MEGVFSIKHCIKKQLLWIILVIHISILLSGCYSQTEDFEVIEDMQAEQTEEQNPDTKLQEIEESSCFVYICGAVKKPDVYEVKSDARIYEVVKKAGGFSKNADETAVNLAEKIYDGQQVYIPTKQEKDKQNLSLQGQGNMEQSDKLDLNTATKEQLMTLSGVGEAKADAILEYRAEHGRFQSIEELKEIRGIKERVFQKMKDKIIVH